jgi:hypothetical protein
MLRAEYFGVEKVEEIEGVDGGNEQRRPQSRRGGWLK